MALGVALGVPAPLGVRGVCCLFFLFCFSASSLRVSTLSLPTVSLSQAFLLRTAVLLFLLVRLQNARSLQPTGMIYMKALAASPC